MIAKELYRLVQEVERLERRIAQQPAGQRDELEDQLRILKAERDRMRKTLEGAKDTPSYRKPL
jgi:hypothetical protein